MSKNRYNIRPSDFSVSKFDVYGVVLSLVARAEENGSVYERWVDAEGNRYYAAFHPHASNVDASGRDPALLQRLEALEQRIKF